MNATSSHWRLLIGLGVLAVTCLFVEPGAANGEERLPLEAVIVAVDDVNDERAAGWKKEGFGAVAIVVDERHDAASLHKAMDAIAAHSLKCFFWIEIARNPAFAQEHPEWMASLGTHQDWRLRFPKVGQPGKGEVVKAWPWVPIGYRETFDAQLARVGRLLERLPDGHDGILLNDLQGGPASCGCGNLQCRWAIDYKVPSTATPLTGTDIAARFVAEVERLAKGKAVIPVWTTECEQEDLSPTLKREQGWTTGLCCEVPCFETCRKRFEEQWTALHANADKPTALLLLHKEFQRNVKGYGEPTGWISQAAGFWHRLGPKPLPGKSLWLVVQGYDVPPEEENAARRAAIKTGAGAILVARTRLDQSYEPRIVPVK